MDIGFYSWTKTKQMLILEIHTGDWVHVVCLGLGFFLGGGRNALIEKLISEIVVLIDCYSQPVRNLVCRLSELFE